MLIPAILNTFDVCSVESLHALTNVLCDIIVFT